MPRAACARRPDRHRLSRGRRHHAFQDATVSPKRLITVAAIWVTAALGCAAGRGDWQILLTATALTVLLLAIKHSVERCAGRKTDGSSAAHVRGP
ncbi:MAG: MgtC/SapB family protein [Comamonadaceae bacterium]|nr:MAG: MgtC/SapB family protein [Comamonadaceae bacterium]